MGVGFGADLGDGSSGGAVPRVPLIGFATRSFAFLAGSLGSLPFRERFGGGSGAAARGGAGLELFGGVAKIGPFTSDERAGRFSWSFDRERGASLSAFLFLF